MDGKQLKNSILQWAIQGKLVPQNPKDEPASVLLAKIRKEKESLVKQGKLKKKDLETTPIDEEEIPFEIPTGWIWARFEDLSLDSADGPFGSNLKKEHYTDKKEVRIIQLSNIGEDGWRDLNTKYTSFEHLKNISRSEAFPGDIIVAKMMPAGRAIICPDMDKKYVLSSDAVRFDFSNLLYKKYLYWAINSTVVKDQVYSEVQGITRVRTSLSKLRTYLIPIPPLAEQKRIVAKLEQVLPLAEEYGAAQEQLDKLNKELPEALKKSILQEAIQGKLVPHLKSDGQADEFLKKIAKEKESLIIAGKIKKEKTSAPISDEEKPFDLPSGWSWIRLGDYCERVTDQVASGSFATLRENVKSLKTPNYAIMVKTADFSNNFSRNLTYTDKHGYEFLSNSNLFGGELILSNIGSIGKVFIVPQMDSPMTLAPNSVMLRLLDENCRDYLYYFLLSPFGYAELMSITSGTAMKKFNKTDLKTIVIPVPPLPEQKRIVKKIEELYKVINSWH